MLHLDQDLLELDLYVVEGLRVIGRLVLTQGLHHGGLVRLKGDIGDAIVYEGLIVLK